MGKKTSSDVLTVSLNISLPFWGMRGRPSKFSKTWVLVENLGLHIWKHKSLMKSCWCIGGNGHRWWTCAKWESWIMLRHKMTSLTSVEYNNSHFMNGRELVSYLCVQNHRSSGRQNLQHRTSDPGLRKTSNKTLQIFALLLLRSKLVLYFNRVA